MTSTYIFVIKGCQVTALLRNCRLITVKGYNFIRMTVLFVTASTQLQGTGQEGQVLPDT